MAPGHRCRKSWDTWTYEVHIIQDILKTLLTKTGVAMLEKTLATCQNTVFTTSTQMGYLKSGDFSIDLGIESPPAEHQVISRLLVDECRVRIIMLSTDTAGAMGPQFSAKCCRISPLASGEDPALGRFSERRLMYSSSFPTWQICVAKKQ